MSKETCEITIKYFNQTWTYWTWTIVGANQKCFSELPSHRNGKFRSHRRSLLLLPATARRPRRRKVPPCLPARTPRISNKIKKAETAQSLNTWCPNNTTQLATLILRNKCTLATAGLQPLSWTHRTRILILAFLTSRQVSFKVMLVFRNGSKFRCKDK